MPAPETVTIDLEPIGIKYHAKQGENLLSVAQNAGVDLTSVCGGIGACDTCRIRLMSGELSDPTIAEQGEFSPDELNAGWRLACQAEALSDVKIDIPPESLTTPQRLQIESKQALNLKDNAYQVIDLALSPPSLEDMRSDAKRLQDALRAQGISPQPLSLFMTRQIPKLGQNHNWHLRVVVGYEDEVIAILPPHLRPYGMAVDIGTTGMAGYLLNLITGEVVAKTGEMNPQIAYGEDVISRIMYLNEHPNEPDILQRRLIETLNKMLKTLCETVESPLEAVVSLAFVGNTAMHHIATGIPAKQLGEAPYVPVTTAPLTLKSHELALATLPQTPVYLPPNIAGYVGADHVAMLIGVDALNLDQTSLIIDIGTNSEVTLIHEGQWLSCSCASGPAFEGAHIKFGMRASEGAIERVSLIDGTVNIQTIGNSDAIGICGSGILDSVAVMVEDKMLKPNGRFDTAHPRLEKDAGGQPIFMLSEGGRSVYLTRKDVSEIQLAKSAIRAGIEILLETLNLSAHDIQKFIIAGAFGSYINVESAIQIGMFPALPLERFEQVGNAAGLGACKLLVSQQSRQDALTIVENIAYIELTINPRFQPLFMQNMSLYEETTI